LADVYYLANPGGFDVSNTPGIPSTAPAWDGALTRTAPGDWRQTDYGNNAHSIAGMEMWAAFLNFQTIQGFWVFQCQMHREGGNDVLLWLGKRPYESGITGVYERVDGCDETTQTVTISEAAP
jgi:hypothetical protein